MDNTVYTQYAGGGEIGVSTNIILIVCLPPLSLYLEYLYLGSARFLRIYSLRRLEAPGDVLSIVITSMGDPHSMTIYIIKAS